MERDADRAADGIAGSRAHRAGPAASGQETEAMQAPPIVHAVMNSPGRPLDAATRATMESRLGHDFSHVRIHTDADAARSANAVRAKAYTVGSHIAFRSGDYAPHTGTGRRLLAHELAHVAQQSALSAGAPLHLSRQHDGTGDDDPLKKKKVAPTLEHPALGFPAQTGMGGAAQPGHAASGGHIPSKDSFKSDFLNLKLPDEHKIQPILKEVEHDPSKIDFSIDQLSGVPESIDEIKNPDYPEVTGKTGVNALGSVNDGKIGVGASVSTPLSPLLAKLGKLARPLRRKLLMLLRRRKKQQQAAQF